VAEKQAAGKEVAEKEAVENEAAEKEMRRRRRYEKETMRRKTSPGHREAAMMMTPSDFTESSIDSSVPFASTICISTRIILPHPIHDDG
jgi:hypothetical protein